MNKLVYQPPKPSRIMRWFWKAAGGDAYILSRSTYSDQIKYFCLGGIVIATAIMAGMSGGYAFYTIFKPKASDVNELWEQSGGHMINNLQGFTETTDIGTTVVAIVFGLIWGLIIYNIDRFIVTSTGKGDGTEAITWGELKNALPRIIMGCIIAISISKPLEIRILKGELDRELSNKQLIEKGISRGKINERYDLSINKIESDLAPFNKRIDEYQITYDRLQEQIEFEIANGGCKSKCESYKRQQRKIDEEILKIKSDARYISLNESKITNEKERQKEINNIENEISKLDGLAERISLAEEHYPAVSWFLTLLFLAIELTPIFFKLMLIKSPYDYMSDHYKSLELAQNGIYIEEDYYEDKSGVQRELVRFLEAEKTIQEKKEFHDAQMRITKYALEKFEEREKEKIDLNPDEFIKYS